MEQYTFQEAFPSYNDRDNNQNSGNFDDPGLQTTLDKIYILWQLPCISPSHLSLYGSFLFLIYFWESLHVRILFSKT